MHEILVVLRLAVVAAGLIVALWAVRLATLLPAHRWTYLLLAAGFALLTFGTTVESMLFLVAGWNLVAAHTVEAFVSAGGFALILVSIVRSRV